METTLENRIIAWLLNIIIVIGFIIMASNNPVIKDMHWYINVSVDDENELEDNVGYLVFTKSKLTGEHAHATYRTYKTRKSAEDFFSGR